MINECTFNILVTNFAYLANKMSKIITFFETLLLVIDMNGFFAEPGDTELDNYSYKNIFSLTCVVCMIMCMYCHNVMTTEVAAF